MYNGSLLNIFKVDDKGSFSLLKQKLFQYPRFEVLVSNSMSKGKIDKDALIGFLNISVTSDKIFALYSGKRKGDDGSYLSDKVLVYDWDLNPVRLITLDRKCYYISVDQNNPNRLFAITGKDNTDNISL
ncbi:BF3164 family lipoprotein [Sphingobacterium multivorum]|uniref:BF3164 family lipoprotein n=1 Tax=Sphingobacterium multivorum TaxID=28454 RepID=UPI003DA1DEA1